MRSCLMRVQKTKTPDGPVHFTIKFLSSNWWAHAIIVKNNVWVYDIAMKIFWQTCNKWIIIYILQDTKLNINTSILYGMFNTKTIRNIDWFWSRRQISISTTYQLHIKLHINSYHQIGSMLCGMPIQNQCQNINHIKQRSI